MAASDEKVDVINRFLDVLGRNALQGCLGPVAVVNAVVPSLEDLLKVLFHVGNAISFCFVLIRGTELPVLCAGDAEDSAFRGCVRDEGVDGVLIQDLMAVAEEVVEELLDLFKSEHVFFLNEFAGCHTPAPSPSCFSKHCDHGNFEIVQSVRNIYVWF